MNVRALSFALGAGLLASATWAQVPASKPSPSPSPSAPPSVAPISPFEEPPPPPHPAMPLAAFKAQHQLHSLIVLDVRSLESYREGHIPGAVSLPLAELEYRADELLKKTKRPIVAYCS
jgi:hypothetical protein